MPRITRPRGKAFPESINSLLRKPEFPPQSYFSTAIERHFDKRPAGIQNPLLGRHQSRQ
jgi:hypothetical protein